MTNNNVQELASKEKPTLQSEIRKYRAILNGCSAEIFDVFIHSAELITWRKIEGSPIKKLRTHMREESKKCDECGADIGYAIGTLYSYVGTAALATYAVSELVNCFS